VHLRANADAVNVYLKDKKLMEITAKILTLIVGTSALKLLAKYAPKLGSALFAVVAILGGFYCYTKDLYVLATTVVVGSVIGFFYSEYNA
jgi:hypothetical protein